MKSTKVVIWAVITVLFLTNALILCLYQGRQIQKETVSRLENGFYAALENAKAVGNSEEAERSVLRGRYIMALTTDTEMEHPVTTATILQHFNGNVVEKSRNLLLCTFDPGRETEYVLPVCFLNDNDQDIAFFLREQNLGRDALRTFSTVVEGYWEDDLFTAVKISGGRMTFSEEDYQGQVERYAASDTDKWQFLESEYYLKSGGRAGQWEKSDKLSEKLAAMDILPDTGEPFQVEKKSLLFTRVVGAAAISDDHQVYDEDLALKLVFGGEFSPVLLAARELWPVLLGVLLSHFAAGVYLAAEYERKKLSREV